MKLTKDMTAQSLISRCQQIFKQYDKPKKIRSDNGPGFIAKSFAEFCKSENITHELITPRWPNANGCCESKMKIINKAARTAHVNGQNWKINLDRALKRYNATPHPSTGYTPNEIMNLPDEIGRNRPPKFQFQISGPNHSFNSVPPCSTKI